MLNQTSKGYFYNHQTKFTTVTFEIVFTQPLETANIEGRNLVAKTIIEGTSEYPTKLEMRRHLASLYSSNVASSVSKDGLLHEITFQFSFIHPDTVDDSEYTFDTIFTTIRSILQEPAMENDMLLEELVQIEKRLMVDRIKRLYDDKTRFAQTRLTEIMFEGTPMVKKAYGDISNYETITRKEVTDTYIAMLADDTVNIYVVGDVPEALVVEELVQVFIKNKNGKVAQEKITYDSSKQPQEVIETQEVQQAKLFMGYQMDGDLTLQRYVASQVATSILGGGLHSKLFMNVREKASLAYTVSAGMDARSVLMFIYAGIDYHKKDEAISIIEKQVQDVIEGNITSEEMHMSKETLIHSIESSIDNPFAIIAVEKMIARVDGEITFSAWIDAIQAVTIDEVIAVATSWKKDTVYILAPSAKEGNGEIDA